MGLSFVHKGSFSKTERFFNRVLKKDYLNILDRYGQLGVDALKAETPVDSGETINAWGYEIHHTKDTTSIIWTNSEEDNGVPIIILLQYGHALKNGGFLQGRDIINPAMKNIFKKLADDVWREVTLL